MRLKRVLNRVRKIRRLEAQLSFHRRGVFGWSDELWPEYKAIEADLESKIKHWKEVHLRCEMEAEAAAVLEFSRSRGFKEFISV